jgi:uncharacterized protein VirK/YbjX
MAGESTEETGTPTKERKSGYTSVSSSHLPISTSGDSLLVRQASLDQPRPVLGLVSRLGIAAREYLGNGGSYRKWPHFKFVARGLLYGRWMRPWLQFLEAEPMLSVARQNPRLYLKVQWPYLNRNYGAQKRLEIMRCHYRFLLERIQVDLREHLLTNSFFTLARWSTPSLGTFSLRLSHQNKFSQEGEMVLSFFRDNPDRLCTLLCFTISGDSEISIGCLQGNKPMPDAQPSNKDFNVMLTRGLHGLRPKNLLLFGLRQLAAAWSIDRLRAVGNRMHIFRESLKCGYDSFWDEAEGVLAPDGMYDLPASPQLKDLKDVPAKKRAMYRRRFQFLEALEGEIAATLARKEREPVILTT